MFVRAPGHGEAGPGRIRPTKGRDDVARQHREVEDCWVLGEQGRRPGVVMAWQYTQRRLDRPGRAHRAHLRAVGLVEEWLPEALLEVA